MRKMLKHIGMPIAVASIAVIVVLAWTMNLSPAQAVAQSAQEARAYITVQISTGDDSVSWSDPDACSSGYNIYLVVNTLVQGSSTGQVTRTHIGSAPSGSTQATLAISHSGGSMFAPSRAKVELYCGEYSADSSQNVLVASTRLSSQGSSLQSSTFSSAPLTALSVGSGALSPSFNRGIYSYSAEVPSDERRVTLSATGLTGYQIVYVKNPSLVLITICGVGGCSYSYGGTTNTGIVLADVDPNTSGFQVDLDGGENRLGIGLHKGDEGAGAKLYYLTVTVQNVPAIGIPTISGTSQVGQTLTANTSVISDEDGLDDVNFSYQWIRVNSDSTEIDIAEATNVTYALASADADKTIRVRVTFTDNAGNQESLASAATSVVTQVAALSTDATLSALILSGVNLGTFDSATTSYTARVNGPVTETTVAPTLNHSGASYVIKLGGVTDADGVIQLTVGSNVITVEVTAEDGQTTRTYTITVTRLDSQHDPISSDATLSGLTLSGIDFGTFGSRTTSYSANVAYTVSQTTVTPTVNHSEASYAIKLSGVTDSDGTLSLRVGSNVITVEVTAEDEATNRTYTVTVTRAGPPSTDASLSALWVNDRNPFSRLLLLHTSSFGINKPSSVTQATIRPVVNHPGASYVIKVDGVEDDDGVVPVVPVAARNNRITIEITAEDKETTRTYYLSLRRQASTDATLSALTLSGIDFGAFSSSTASYAPSVANSVSQTTVTATTNHFGAGYAIKLGGTTDSDGTVSLSTGSNVITVEVTAEDGQTTKTYTVTVTRSSQPSTDTSLRALTLSGIDFGTFASGTTSYTAEVANSLSQTTVTPAVNEPGASYVIKLDGVEDADGTITLAVGNNVIAIEVTAEDGQATRTYTVTVTRLVTSEPNLASIDATLSGLTLSGIDFGTFASSTESYTASVANSVSQTTVTPTVNDSGASYVIKIGGVEDADGTVSLAVGSNVITVQVVAEDDSITKTYAVTVARAESPNSAATGAPTVSGTAQVGQTLTASTSDITDSDGLSNATFAYQWLTSRDAEIDGATSSAYTLVGADEGKSIKVRVSFTDDRGQQETLTSGATAIVAASPSPLTASIHGAPTSHDGQSVLKLELRFSEEFSISYVTLRDHAFTVTGGSVVGARRLERGRNIRWELGVRPESNADVTVVLPVTTDCATQGAICTGDGRKLSNRLELAVDGPVVSSPNSAATGAPTIGGTAQVGQTLTASTSGITDSDGLSNATFAFQWLSSDGTNDSDISGATSSAYTLVETDEGKTVKVRVSFTDDADNAETLTSGATAAVAAARSPLTVSLTGGAPTTHDGSAIFIFELRFSEEFSISYVTLRDHAFTVTGGSILKAQRTNRPSNIPWRITVQPGSSGDVGIVLPAASDCGATGAICTEDGRMLSNRLKLTVRGPGQ